MEEDRQSVENRRRDVVTEQRPRLAPGVIELLDDGVAGECGGGGVPGRVVESGREIAAMPWATP
jgi:hypothetical protein